MARTESIEHPDAQPCKNWFEIQAFRQRYDVKPKELGADIVWYLERRLGRNVLWAREFNGGFPNTSTDDECQLEFSSAVEALREVQADVPLWEYGGDLLSAELQHLPIE